MSNCLKFEILEIFRASRKKCDPRQVTNKYHDLLVCRLEGKTTLNVGKKKISVKRGEILYIPKDAEYSHKCTEDETVVSIFLDISGSAKKNITVYTPENPDEICDLFEELFNTWQNKQRNYAYKSYSQLYHIICASDAFMQSEESQNINNLIRKGMRYIDTNFCDPDFSFDAPCYFANMSRAYFNRIFKKEYGITPTQYIQKKRIDKAILLLGNSDYTREEIATFCGFNDVKYFYTIFKKVTGKTIKEYFAEQED